MISVVRWSSGRWSMARPMRNCASRRSASVSGDGSPDATRSMIFVPSGYSPAGSSSDRFWAQLLLPFLQFVDAEIGSNLVEPCREFCDRLVALGVAKNAHECFLSNIFSRFAVAQKRIAEGNDLRFVAGEQFFFESVVRCLARQQLHQQFVAGLGACRTSSSGFWSALFHWSSAWAASFSASHPWVSAKGLGVHVRQTPSELYSLAGVKVTGR